MWDRDTDSSWICSLLWKNCLMPTSGCLSGCCPAKPWFSKSHLWLVPWFCLMLFLFVYQLMCWHPSCHGCLYPSLPSHSLPHSLPSLNELPSLFDLFFLVTSPYSFLSSSALYRKGNRLHFKMVRQENYCEFGFRLGYNVTLCHHCPSAPHPHPKKK